jgi:predicted nucleotide-binding protein (sugar kinase/HSP70/actin superfamily)
MPKLHSLKEWLNDQAINQNQTDQINTLEIPVICLESISFLRSEYSGFSKYHFGILVQNKKSRDEDVKFT